MMMEGMRTVLAVGTVGRVPEQPSYRIRYLDNLNPMSLAAMNGATYVDYDYFEVPFAAERVLFTNSPACSELIGANDLLLSNTSHLDKEYPRYIDAAGNEMAPRPQNPQAAPYLRRHAKQTLVTGERIVLAFSCMIRSWCSQNGYCPNRVLWKFAISADNTLDFSEFYGPSRLTLDEAEAWLRSRVWLNLQGPAPDAGPADAGVGR